AGIATPATIDLRAVQALLNQVQKATGIAATGAGVGIVMQVHVTGTVAGQPVDASFSPTAGFQLQPLELTPSGSAPAGGATSSPTPTSETGCDPSAPGKVAVISSVPNDVTVAGHVVSYATVAWLALAGVVLAGGLAAFLGVLLKRNQA